MAETKVALELDIETKAAVLALRQQKARLRSGLLTFLTATLPALLADAPCVEVRFQRHADAVAWGVQVLEIFWRNDR
jgi:hypothetical protein